MGPEGGSEEDPLQDTTQHNHSGTFVLSVSVSLCHSQSEITPFVSNDLTDDEGINLGTSQSIQELTKVYATRTIYSPTNTILRLHSHPLVSHLVLSFFPFFLFY